MIQHSPIINDIQLILRHAHHTAYKSINKAMVEAYWLVGKRIVEEEQQGEAKAVYGKGLLKKLSEELGKEFGKGFSIVNLQNMRLFYLQYPIQQTASVKLDGEVISDTVSRKLPVPFIT